MNKALRLLICAVMILMQFVILLTQLKHTKELKKLNSDNEIVTEFRAAIVDPNGVGMLNLMMKNAGIPQQYVNMLYKIEENNICIDCGANVGLISDIFLKLGARCYAFEPSKECINILKQKFSGNNKFKLIEAAVSNKNGETAFLTTSPFDVGGNIVDAHLGETNQILTYTVKIIRLSDFIKNLLKTEDKIYLLKLDIEGAEFDVLEDLINTGVYKNIKFIICETHERFSKELEEKFKHVKQLIKDNEITNIYLDWI